jgi:hypothetical protein
VTWVTVRHREVLMPWKESSPLDQRVRFIADVQQGALSMSELCERYDVSRKTGSGLMVWLS